MRAPFEARGYKGYGQLSLSNGCIEYTQLMSSCLLVNTMQMHDSALSVKENIVEAP